MPTSPTTTSRPLKRRNYFVASSLACATYAYIRLRARSLRLVFAPFKRPAGFTLLEVMIVVAIIAAIAAFSIPKISNRKSEAQAILRKFIVLSRDLRNRAKLQNATYRIAIDLGDPVKKTGQAFWVEKASGEVINDYDPKNPPKIQKESDKKNDEEAEKTPTQFSPDPSIYKKPQELPPPLEFSEVELAFLEEPVESGIVYIHFKPSGYADESAIHLSTSEKSKWTIYIQPLTGRAEIINEDRPLENLRPK